MTAQNAFSHEYSGVFCKRKKNSYNVLNDLAYFKIKVVCEEVNKLHILTVYVKSKDWIEKLALKFSLINLSQLETKYKLNS